MRNAWTVFRPEIWKANYIYIYTMKTPLPSLLEKLRVSVQYRLGVKVGVHCFFFVYVEVRSLRKQH